MVAANDPKPPMVGAIVKPVGAQNIAATNAYLSSVSALSDYADEGWRRVGAGRDWCQKQK